MYFALPAATVNDLPTAAGTTFLPYGGLVTSDAVAENRMQMIAPIAFTMQNLIVNVDNAPGAGNSWAFTIRKNGVDTALTVTVSGGSATSATDLTDQVSFAPGDLISMKLVSVGTPTASTRARLAGLGAGASQAIMGGSFNGGTPSSSAATYCNPSSSNGGGATEVFNNILISAPGTISNLYLNFTQTPPGVGKNYVAAVRLNGVSQTLTATIADANTTASDNTHSFNVVAGDIVSVQFTPTGTPAGGLSFGVSVAFTPTTSGQCVYGGTFAAPSTSVNNFNCLFTNSTAQQTTENVGTKAAPGPCIIKSLFINQVVAPGGVASYTYTVRQNAADTSLVATVSGASTIANSGNAALVTVQQGDTVDLKIVPAGTPAGATNMRYGICIVFPTKNFFAMFRSLGRPPA